MARGRDVFRQSGCAGCHTPPFYTKNKLTLAEGFSLPDGAAQKHAVMTLSVGTDPQLAMKTRRGSGYYKVPSLIGVSHRGMFGHNGWCAALEDWFNPKRVREDYCPADSSLTVPRRWLPRDTHSVWTCHPKIAARGLAVLQIADRAESAEGRCQACHAAMP